MTNHAMFSLYIMTGLLALVISVSLFCKSIAEAKEWKRKFGERNWGYLFQVLMFFKPRRRRKIRCTETGVVYESIKDAAERTKISPNGIGSAASGMAGGYHWEYADD